MLMASFGGVKRHFEMVETLRAHVHHERGQQKARAKSREDAEREPEEPPPAAPAREPEGASVGEKVDALVRTKFRDEGGYLPPSYLEAHRLIQSKRHLNALA